MNISGLIGFIAAFGLVIYGIIGNPGEFSTGEVLARFLDQSSALIVLGGTLGALLLAFPFRVIANVPKMFKMVFFPKKYKPREVIEQMVEYSKIARTKSLLALEESANDCSDPFMKTSLMLIVDANDSERVKSMLDDAIDFMCERHEQNYSFFDKGSALAPAFGMVGTLIGLINMLATMDPETLGADMSIALVTTFYGSLLANAFFAPISTRLKANHADELLCKQIIEEGALAILSGANPRYIQEKLEVMLPEGKTKKSKKFDSSSDAD